MGSGTICITDDQSQWVLEQYVLQTTRVNGFWNYMYYRRPESMGSGTIVQYTRVNGFWIYITVDQIQWVLEL